MDTYHPTTHKIIKLQPPFHDSVVVTKVRPKKLLSIGTNAKTVKSDKASEYLTAILYMSPAKQNGKKVNLCPKASAGCEAACLYTAGRGAFSSVQKARVAKADWFVEDRASFLEQLHKEILRHSFNSRLVGKKPAIRLNGTSDIIWERYINMSLFPEVQFYDYTKWEPASERRTAEENYHLTYSRAEDTCDNDVKHQLQMRYNVAIVFSGTLPEEYLGYPVFNGDKTDLRFLDPVGHIIGLSAKGDAKKDTSGFVVKS